MQSGQICGGHKSSKDSLSGGRAPNIMGVSSFGALGIMYGLRSEMNRGIYHDSALSRLVNIEKRIVR